MSDRRLTICEMSVYTRLERLSIRYYDSPTLSVDSPIGTVLANASMRALTMLNIELNIDAKRTAYGHHAILGQTPYSETHFPLKISSRHTQIAPVATPSS
jgi:hypothetical protein